MRAGERVHIVHVVNREGRCAMGSVATTPHSPQNLEGFGVTDIDHSYFFRNKNVGAFQRHQDCFDRSNGVATVHPCDGQTDRQTDGIGIA